MSGPSRIDELVRDTLGRLGEGAPAPGREEALIRALAGWEREHRTALASRRRLADALDGRTAADPAALDEEETAPALRRRLAELRGLREGFVKALALTLGHEAAARIEAAARARAAAPDDEG